MRKIIVPALLFLTISAEAQRTKKPPIDFQRAISFNPLMLVGPDFTFTAGYEHRIRPNLVLSPELGLIVGSAHYTDGGNTGGAYGVLFRPSIKFFVDNDRNFYFQPQLFYKAVYHKMNDWLGMDCVDDVPAYEEFKNFNYRRQAMGFNVIGGVLVPNRSGKLIFDFYLGFGVRHKSGKVVGEPRACYNNQGAGFGTVNENGTYPNVPAGIKLLFVLN